MNSRLLGSVVIALAWVALLAALVWPVAALIGACLSQGSPEGGWVIGGRVWGLLGKTALMSSTATLGCLLISIPPAIALARIGRSSIARVLATLLLGSLLCPPMVYVFGWDHWWPVGPSTTALAGGRAGGLPGGVLFDPVVRCVIVWALWAWPIPAAVLSAAWMRRGRAAHQAALLDAGPVSALIATAAPALRAPLLFLAIVLVMLFLGEYSVPHAGGLTVFATELLGRAEGSARAIAAAWPATPSVGVIALLLLSAYLILRRQTEAAHEEAEDGPRRGAPGAAVLVFAWWAGSWALPIIALLDRLPSWRSAGDALTEYGGAIVISTGLALAAGVTASVLAIGLITSRRLWPAVVVLAILLGALPGALVGDAVRAGYLHVPAVYDHWGVILIGYVARFSWVAVLILWPARRTMSSPPFEQARMDGAARADLLARMLLPLHAPRLIAAAAIVTALSLGDAATPALLQVPGIPLVSRIIIEKFHRMEDGMLVSLSLTTVAVAMMAATVVAVASRRMKG